MERPRRRGIRRKRGLPNKLNQVSLCLLLLMLQLHWCFRHFLPVTLMKTFVTFLFCLLATLSSWLSYLIPKSIGQVKTTKSRKQSKWTRMVRKRKRLSSPSSSFKVHSVFELRVVKRCSTINFRSWLSRLFFLFRTLNQENTLSLKAIVLSWLCIDYQTTSDVSSHTWLVLQKLA